MIYSDELCGDTRGLKLHESDVISVPSLIKTYIACLLQVIQTLSCYLIGRINEWKCYVTTSPDWEHTIYFDTI